MSQERTKYADSILTTKGPYEASETVRIRLSQAKLINKNFYLFFKEIANLKKSYTQQLRKIIDDNEDLNKILKSQMLETKVLTEQEMGNFNFESLGDLESIWLAIVDELKADLRASSEFCNTLEEEVIGGLERANENDHRWSQSKKMHSNLSQVAANIDYLVRTNDRDGKLDELSKRWDTQGPMLFELFETIDHDRLATLKKCALRYQTGYGDYILSTSKQSEESMEKFLEFDPDVEIDRFAREASRYSFQPTPVAVDGASPSPSPAGGNREKRKSVFGTVGNIGHRFTSQSTGNTVLHHDLNNDEFSDGANSGSSSGPGTTGKKPQSKLRSKVGSIFGKGKLRSRRNSEMGGPQQSSIIHEPSDDEYSLRRSGSATHARDTLRDNGGDAGPRAADFNKDDDTRGSYFDGVGAGGAGSGSDTRTAPGGAVPGGAVPESTGSGYYQPPNSTVSGSYAEPTPAATAASNLNTSSYGTTDTMNSPNMTQAPTRPLDRQEPQRSHQQIYDPPQQNMGVLRPNSNNAAPLNNVKAPTLPPVRNGSIDPMNRNSATTENRTSVSGLGASGPVVGGLDGSDVPSSFPRQGPINNNFAPANSAGQGAPNLGGNIDQGSVPLSSNAGSAGLPINNIASPEMVSSAEGTRESANNLLRSQVTGDLTVLNPQVTGPSTSTKGQNVFQHSSLEGTSAYGLNASIAEVISCTFREGIVVDSQLIGELALNYVSNTAMNTPLPIEINLKIDKANNFSKMVLNQAFIQRTEAEFFKVNPLFIDGRTLGAVKYSMDNPSPPVTIQPVWRFEPHQASVVLTIKFSPSVPLEVNKLVLEDVAVFVSIAGAETNSALSKPQGSFSKEKKRIAWRFKEPLVLHRNGEERLIARFITDRTACESENGVSTKFIIRGQGPREGDIGSGISLRAQDLDENNPFGGPWDLVNCTRTLTAGNYYGLSQ
ncbi:ZYRO0D17138p [Zygosaccharomyces rouxii]|uniref:ZYRO0D17138p n=2 Tax=Zygosaccharomyces rouxii TaxID=4956 RepID=C5DWS2_ZYGRC|nr:uncharacterized protein ZYRO0D17138g [Zygosaccharomyces rouxii]KAH9201151.1 Muniscin C-terminal mu homology domain-containing protein [Zygosaccharomyces rouxii]CAQ43501.1 Suppressor of yeast profilin deletion [Zygosaccharomyces rouxii]CAR28241.1 ZYRO0D17138p [Zygosaccharomyces rouxii]